MKKNYQEFMEDLASEGTIGALEKMGVSISEDVVKGLPENQAIANLNAAKAKMMINSKSPAVTDSHYVEVAYNEHLKSGGKSQEFKDDLKRFVRNEPAQARIRKKEVVNG